MEQTPLFDVDSGEYGCNILFCLSFGEIELNKGSILQSIVADLPVRNTYGSISAVIKFDEALVSFICSRRITSIVYELETFIILSVLKEFNIVVHIQQSGSFDRHSSHIDRKLLIKIEKAFAIYRNELRSTCVHYLTRGQYIVVAKRILE